MISTKVCDERSGEMKVYSLGDNNAPSIMLFPEDYRARYKQHFADPIIHEQNLQHEELLACYPDQWVQLVKSIAEGKTIHS